MGLSSRLKSAPFSQSPTGQLNRFSWMLPITCHWQSVFARFVAGQLQTVFMSERHFGIFGISDVWYPFISNKGREFVWRAESEGFRSSRIGLVAEVQA